MDMVAVITYSLRNGQKKSDRYYRDIAFFADEVLSEVEEQAGNLIDAYMEYIQSTSMEELRAEEEYAFEFLTLGTLWRVYASASIGLNKPPQQLLLWLVHLRRTYSTIKPFVDIIRGVLAGLLLFSPNHSKAESLPLTMDNLDFTLDWLDAAGDFREEVKRLHGWRDFLASQLAADTARILNTSLELAAWFEETSLDRLGHYTMNVESFLETALPRYRWREDRVFVSRQRVEYHLNMVGTYILNTGMREEFLKTKRKLVLLPPCMRAKSNGECKATETPYGDKCAACTPGCRIHQATKLGEKFGFEVLMLPPELSVFSSKKETPSLNNTIGIIGASCPLTNVTGAWETRDMGVPAQGILLDYVGCIYHWDIDGGIPTDINFDQLLRILDLKD
jgi:hypothetical protein